MTRGRGRTPQTVQPDPLAAIKATLDQMELYLVLIGLISAVDADDENAFAILAHRRQFTTPSGRHFGGDDKELWQDDWEGIAGPSLGPRFREAISNYEHRLELGKYVAMFQPHYDAYQSATAPDAVRLAALTEMFALWHEDLRQASYVQARTRLELEQRYLSQHTVDRLVVEALSSFIASRAGQAEDESNRQAFWELYDLRSQYRGTGEPLHDASSGKELLAEQGQIFKILPSLRAWFVWTDPVNWELLVDLHIRCPSPADFGDDQMKISPQKFAELAAMALAKTGTRAMAKRAYALIVAGRNNLNAVTADRLQRKASRPNP